MRNIWGWQNEPHIPSPQGSSAQSEASSEVRPGPALDASAKPVDSGQVRKAAFVEHTSVKPMVVVDADAMAQERRKAIFAYIASFLAQIIAGFFGWHLHANWDAIVARLQ